MKYLKLFEDYEFNYMMLGRLVSDCEYFLNNGSYSENVLYYKDVDKHISEMKNLWDKLDIKPEWLSMEDIEEYEKMMKKK